jgi:hypothetical protein
MFGQVYLAGEGFAKIIQYSSHVTPSLSTTLIENNKYLISVNDLRRSTDR